MMSNDVNRFDEVLITHNQMPSHIHSIIILVLNIPELLLRGAHPDRYYRIHNVDLFASLLSGGRRSAPPFHTLSSFYGQSIL